MSSEPAGLLSAKPHPLSFTVFSFKTTEGTRGQTDFSGCDTGCDSFAV